MQKGDPLAYHHPRLGRGATRAAAKCPARDLLGWPIGTAAITLRPSSTFFAGQAYLMRAVALHVAEAVGQPQCGDRPTSRWSAPQPLSHK
jgi:hypothetical protein